MIGLKDLTDSWETEQGVNSNEELCNRILQRKQQMTVSINKISLQDCAGWVYDSSSGRIRRNNMDFFAISGLKKYRNNVVFEQPIIEQPEIGYLGILCKKVNNVLHFLMQLKIEPGNINVVQISPTIQATKSNFTQKHGGSRPAYLDYFLSAPPKSILVDQIQSEQSSRFLHKRNRNIIRYLDEDENIEVLPSHMWMTLGQIKWFMTQDNAVNMDTRTVLSCLPFSFLAENETVFGVRADQKVLTEIYNSINDYKMFEYVEPERIPLFSLKNWHMNENEFVCKNGYPFKIIFCDIQIAGREVRYWCQPLFEATTSALFGLITTINDKTGCMEMLVRLKPEIGCFDGVEIGPTLQQEGNEHYRNDEIIDFFMKQMKEGKNVQTDVMQSEEGGRFYHEQNRNVIIHVNKSEVPQDIPGYIWCDFGTINYLTQINNCVNIQLRSLISMIQYPGIYAKEMKND